MYKELKKNVQYVKFETLDGYLIGDDGSLFNIRFKKFIKLRFNADLTGDSYWRLRLKVKGKKIRIRFSIKLEMVRHFTILKKPIKQLIKRLDGDIHNNEINNFIYNPSKLELLFYNRRIDFWTIKSDRVIILHENTSHATILDLVKNGYVVYRTVRLIYGDEVRILNDYIVNTDGEIYSLKTGKYLRNRIGTHGYRLIDIGGGKVLIHRIIASSFIPNKSFLENVDHVDENKLNNSITNLRWLTSGDNTRAWIKNNYEIFKKKMINMTTTR